MACDSGHPPKREHAHIFPQAYSPCMFTHALTHSVCPYTLLHLPMHTHVHTTQHWWTLAHICMQIHLPSAHSYSHTLTSTCIPLHAFALVHAHTLTCTLSYMHPLTITCACTHKAYTHTHMLTYTLILSPLHPCTNIQNAQPAHTHSHTRCYCTSPTPACLPAYPSRTAQAWPRLMAAPCCLCPLGSIYFS